VTRFGLAGLMALPLLLAHSGTANAQFPSRHGCAGCMAFGARMHQHGPLYDYSSLYAGCGYGYGGGYGGGGCGPAGCFGLNRAPMSRGFYGGDGSGLFHRGDCGGGLFSGGLLHGGLLHGGLLHGGLFHRGCDSCGGGWGRYAVSTFRNVFHRCHPLASRCGHSCDVSYGTTGGCSTCGAGAPAPVAPVTPANPAPAAMPTK
jgi:hypothetical protein